MVFVFYQGERGNSLVTHSILQLKGVNINLILTDGNRDTRHKVSEQIEIPNQNLTLQKYEFVLVQK